MVFTWFNWWGSFDHKQSMIQKLKNQRFNNVNCLFHVYQTQRKPFRTSKYPTISIKNEAICQCLNWIFIWYCRIFHMCILINNIEYSLTFYLFLFLFLSSVEYFFSNLATTFSATINVRSISGRKIKSRCGLGLRKSRLHCSAKCLREAK